MRASWVFTWRLILFLGMCRLLYFERFPNVPFCCCLGFLEEFLDELFVESWPCGEDFFLIADISVDVHGLHSARWRKLHRSAFDFD